MLCRAGVLEIVVRMERVGVAAAGQYSAASSSASASAQHAPLCPAGVRAAGGGGVTSLRRRALMRVGAGRWRAGSRRAVTRASEVGAAVAISGAAASRARRRGGSRAQSSVADQGHPSSGAEGARRADEPEASYVDSLDDDEAEALMESEDQRMDYAYDTTNDDDLAASLFVADAGGDDYDDVEEGAGAGAAESQGAAQGEGAMEVGDGMASAAASGSTFDENEGEDGGGAAAGQASFQDDDDDDEEYEEEEEPEYDVDYLDPSDWRSLQLLAESGGGGVSGMADAGDEGEAGKQAFARDTLIEMHDAFLASSFFEVARARHRSSAQQQAALSILSSEFGTSTRRKKRTSKKKQQQQEESLAAAEATEEGEAGELPALDDTRAGAAAGEMADKIHPSRVSGTSEWYPETSERCLFYHERLRDCALNGEGDKAVVVLEEMRMAGILPGPKAYVASSAFSPLPSFRFPSLSIRRKTSLYQETSERGKKTVEKESRLTNGLTRFLLALLSLLIFFTLFRVPCLAAGTTRRCTRTWKRGTWWRQ